MRLNIMLPVATAFAMLASPALAQDDPPVEATASVTLSAEQQAAYDGWPAELQGQYDAWPEPTQAYFWTLTAERQELFWRLSDANKVTLSGLPSETQAQAWAQIEAQATAPTAPEADEPAR